jgi:GNAT acetyltransferase-like protein
VRVLPESDHVRDRYTDLVTHCSSATVYQTTPWLDVWKHLGAHLAFVEIDSETMVPFVCRGRGALRRAYSLPFDTYGGPVTARTHGPVSFESTVEPLGHASARVVDFAARMASSNGAARRATSHVVDLSRGYEAVAARYSESNQRLIRQAREHGVRIDVIEDPAHVRAFHALHLRTVARYSARPLPRAFFEAAFASLVPGGLATFYLARHEGRVVAGNLVLRHRDRSFDWMWVYDDRHLQLRATNLMIDRALRDEAERGSRELNLGASPNERLGSVRFKQSFGAEPFDYTVYAHTGRLVAAARRTRENSTRFTARLRVLFAR